MKLKLPKFAVNALVNYAKKTPFDHLGDYMERYWVFDPKGFFSRWFTARVHVIKRSDADRHLHDHPWSYTTFILKGGYTEVTHHNSFPPLIAYVNNQTKCGGNYHSVRYNDEMNKWECRITYGPGSIIHRKAGSPHRLEIGDGESATTLFVMSKYQNKWGFYTPEGKIYWRDYLDKEDVTKRAVKIDEHYNDRKSA